MTELDFLDNYEPAAFERLSVTVDLVLLGLHQGKPTALLVKRDQHPFADKWALPGGFVRIDEALDDAAKRILQDKAGIQSAHLEQLYTFGAVKRDPRMRIISVAYLGLLAEDAFASAQKARPSLLAAGIDVPWPGEKGGLVEVRSRDCKPISLAFDHADILAMAILRLRGKLDYSDVGFAWLPEHFTLRQLQDVHEAILGTSLNKSAFRRRMLDRGWIEGTGERETGASFRPAELYRFKPQN